MLNVPVHTPSMVTFMGGHVRPILYFIGHFLLSILNPYNLLCHGYQKLLGVIMCSELIASSRDNYRLNCHQVRHTKGNS